MPNDTDGETNNGPKHERSVDSDLAMIVAKHRLAFVLSSCQSMAILLYFVLYSNQMRLVSIGPLLIDPHFVLRNPYKNRNIFTIVERSNSETSRNKRFRSDALIFFFFLSLWFFDFLSGRGRGKEFIFWFSCKLTVTSFSLYKFYI